MNEENNLGVGNINVVETFYQPIKEQQKLYGDQRYNFFRENNVDPAELIGIQRDPNATLLGFKKDDPNKEENNPFFVKDLVNFISDIPDQSLYRITLGGMNAARFGVNLLPTISRLLGSEPGEDRFNDITKFSVNLDNELKTGIAALKETYKQGFEIAKGRDPNKASDFVSYIAQDYPYAAPIYKTLDKIGVPKIYSIPLSVGLSSGIAFDPKVDESSLFFDSAAIQGLKTYFNALPDTPEGEIFDRAYQTFEGTGLAAAIGPIINTAVFLKRNVPAFNKAIPGTAVATGSATAIGEITDQTILNPKEDQNVDMQNQDQSMLDTIKGGIDQFGNKLTEIGGAIKKEFSGEAMANPLIKKGVDELAPKLAPVFKSAVVDAVEKIPNKAPGNQILGTIKNIPGVTQTEMKWIGLDDFLKDKPSVTKQEVSDFIQSNKIDVVERKYTGEQKLPEDFVQKVKSFESKWSDLSTKEITDKVKVGDWQFENLNYDQYKVSFGKEKGNMDFNTLSQVLGTKPSLDDLIKLENGNLTVKDKSTLGGGFLKEDKKRIDTFQINPVEFEKYQIENERRKFSKLNPQAKFEIYTEKGGSDYTELVFKINKNEMPVEADMAGKVSMSYRSPSAHYGQVGEFAHVRFKTREYNGQKILSVEEMQSDIMNQIKDGELKLTSGLKVTDFPFKNNWYEFVTKRLTRYAADNGFDSIAFQKGVVSADRYNELKKLDKFNIGSIDEKRGLIGFEASDTNNVLQISDQFKIDNLKKEYPKIAPEVISFVQELQKTKGMTRQAAKEFLIDLNSKSRNFEIAVETTLENYYSDASKGVRGLEFTSKQPIEIGGEGKKEFYDKIVPNYVKKYAKKWNAPVYDDVIDTNKIPVTILKLTPEMKRSVQDKSQPLFNIVLPALSAGGGAKVISDNMENNTISNPTKN